MKREKVQIHQLRVGPSWMDPIVLFLNDNILLEEKGEANKVQRKFPRFWLSDNQKLYKRSFFRTIFIMHPPRSNGDILGRVAQRNLWEPYKRKILISPSPYSRILVNQYEKGSIGVREEV